MFFRSIASVPLYSLTPTFSAFQRRHNPLATSVLMAVAAASSSSFPPPLFLLSLSLSKPSKKHIPCSVRSKRLLGLKNVDVYSLGFYVDPATISTEEAKKTKATPMPS